MNENVEVAGVLKAVTGLTRSRVARAQLEHDSADGEGRGLTASTDSAEADQPGHVRIATGGRISIHKRHADDGQSAPDLPRRHYRVRAWLSRPVIASSQ